MVIYVSKKIVDQNMRIMKRAVENRAKDNGWDLKSVCERLWKAEVGGWKKPCLLPDLQGQLQLQSRPQSAQREGVPLFTVRAAGKQ